MAISCEPQDVATDARCFTCRSEKTLLGMMVYLLGRILLIQNPMADVSPDAVAAASNCYTCKLSGKGLYGAIVYLLCQLTGGGGIGSTTWIYWEDAHVDDNPPSDPTKAVERRFRDGDSPLVWDPVELAWV